MRIAVVAPSSRFNDWREVEARVHAIAAAHHPGVEVHFHPQCCAGRSIISPAPTPSAPRRWSRSPTIPPSTRSGSRAAAMASNRIAADAIAAFGPAARGKAWLGYSDAGFLLAGLYKAGYADVAHGPMPQGRGARRRRGGRARALWTGWSPAPARRWSRIWRPGGTHAAFNLTVLGDLARHAARARPRRPCAAARGGVRADVRQRSSAVPHQRAARRCAAIAGIRLGRVSDVIAEPSRTSAMTRQSSSATGACGPGSPIWAAPTSATIRPTRWSRSAASELSGADNPQKSRRLGGKRARFAPCPPLPRALNCALSALRNHREGSMAQGRQSGLQRPVKPSADLAAITGSDPLPRSQVVSKVWDHIRKNNLQNPAEQARDPRRRQAEEDLRQGPLLDVRDEQASVQASELGVAPGNARHGKGAAAARISPRSAFRPAIS